jgi:hypothetical protein
MKRILLFDIITAALVAVLCCSMFAQNAELSEHDYAVLSDFLRIQLKGKNGSDDVRVGRNGSVIASLTTVSLKPIDREWRKELMKIGVVAETLESFESCAGKQMIIKHNLNLPVEYDLLPEETKNPKKLYLHYPRTHGYLGFSCVGINKSGSKALFSVERLMTHSAVGKWVLMVRDPFGDWVVKNELVTWIS